MKLSEAPEHLNITIKCADEKKRNESKGKGCVHHLKNMTSDGTIDNVYLQLPRALTFGIRPNMNNNGPIPKYQLTLKYAFEQKNTVVEPLREIHDLIKTAIVIRFNEILPNTTRNMIKKFQQKKSKVAVPDNDQDIIKVLFSDDVSEQYEQFKAAFFEAAAEKIDEICTFGGSEEDFQMHRGKAKMVTFAPAKTGKDGKNYDKAWTINVSCPIQMKRGGGVEFCTLEDGEIDRNCPVFNFTACESPENNLKDVSEIPKDMILDKLAPKEGTPFSREGISVVSLPYVHVRDDESSISVNVSLEHFHALLREQGTVLGKRTFSVVEDDDTPQDEDTYEGADSDANEEQSE
jgi:hypothetical protein